MKGTSKFGLWYDRSNDFTLSAYTDADWVGSMDDRKSTSGGSFFCWRKIGFLVKQEVVMYLTKYSREKICCSNNQKDI